jgi:SNF2 family DNA or RNA helicase
MFCFECIQSSYHHDTQRKCPLCREPAGTNSLEELVLENAQPVVVEEDTNCYVPDLQGNQMEMPKAIYKQIKDAENITSSKIQKIIDLAKSNEDKLIVFTQFHNAWKYLCSVMALNDISFVSIEGKMTPKQRFDSIRRFQNESSVRVFVMTTKTASVGITLTAGSHIIFLEPCENEGLRKQAIGRAWRIGQINPVTVTTLETEGTIDNVRPNNILTHLQGQSQGLPLNV